MEGRMTFLMHGLSDIFQVISPVAFGAPDRSWRDVGLRSGESFKTFVRTRFRKDLSNGAVAGDVFRQLESGSVGCEAAAREAWMGCCCRILGEVQPSVAKVVRLPSACGKEKLPLCA
jgi:hypothetical protein